MIVKDLKVGDVVTMGMYAPTGNYEPEPIDWIKVSKQNDFITARAIDYIMFDAYEGYGVDNSDFTTSNIAQFLNSDEEHWFEKAHEADVAPTGYYGYVMHPGFLNLFEDYECDVIEQSNTPYGSYKVRLATSQEICGPAARRFQYFRRWGYRPHPTRTLHRKFTYLTENGFVPFWCMDQGREHGLYGCVAIERTGSWNAISASSSSGLRPVCRLRSNAEVYPINYLYAITPHEVSADSSICTDEEIFALLGL